MPRFSMTSQSRLATCHPDLQRLFEEVVKTWDCSILEGHRDQERQDRFHAEGKSKLLWPHSKHNGYPSMAVDVSPYPVPPWKAIEDFAFFGGYVLGIAHGLYLKKKMIHKIRFGGDWDGDQRISDEHFQDLLHFELIK